MNCTNAQIYTRKNNKTGAKQIVYQGDFTVAHTGKIETLRIVTEEGKPARINRWADGQEKQAYLNKGWQDYRAAVIADLK